MIVVVMNWLILLAVSKKIYLNLFNLKSFKRFDKSTKSITQSLGSKHGIWELSLKSIKS